MAEWQQSLVDPHMAILGVDPNPILIPVLLPGGCVNPG